MNTPNPDKTYFVSDTHFGHRAIIDLCKRPFADRDEMDAEMIKRWNATVPHDGTVYHLGDVSFRGKIDTLAILSQLNGHIVLVRGNHDHGMNAAMKTYFTDIRDYAELKIGGHFIIMMHYPLESWNQMHYGSWHLHGHSHGNMPAYGKRMDVGVDALKVYEPVSFWKIKPLLDAREAASRDHHQPRVDAGTKQA